MGGIGILFELLSVIVDLSLLKEVREEDIEKNINQLKKHSWFQDYLKNEQYRSLIFHDQEVRHTIGRLKTKKFEKFGYHEKCHEKLDKVIWKKLYKLKGVKNF
ncbi:hypothetical protein ACFSTA_06660 [Ornithinibacillus salinisoli]|uniref:Uncharacterized protein n=1 Tax=Ornithinibacillus salinisoli TaxID=1848459 RepID=A0ABW4VW52_9BACI